MDKVNILGVNFDNKTFNQFQNEFISRLNDHLSTFVVTANPEIISVETYLCLLVADSWC